MQDDAQHWYLVHTKPRQEQRALDNLERQGYPCFLPRVRAEKLKAGRRVIDEVVLFPRYLFVRLRHDLHGPSWTPIRSTLGVTRLVTFGHQPARVPDGIVAQLQRQIDELSAVPRPLFRPGQPVRISQGPFAGLEAIYQMPDGEERAIVLLTLLQRECRLAVPLTQLRT